MIDKGYVSSILDGGKKVTVIPATSGDVVTQPLTVPFFLLGTMKPRKEVVFCSFPDGTGLVLAALDGGWNHNLTGNVSVAGTLSAGAVAASGAISGGSVSTGGVDLGSHTHTDSRGGATSGPQ
jgi:hypothetical protein